MKKTDIIILILLLILIVTYIFIKIFTIKSESFLNDYTKRKSITMITNITNNSIKEVLLKNDYDNLIYIEKNANNDITNMNFDNKKINNILFLFTNSVANSIFTLEHDKLMIYYVPIGIMHSLPVLTNIGPKIPFKINILGDVKSETKTNVKEYGINNSMIEILLNVELQVQIIFPFKSETTSVKKEILLDSKIIQGNIPNTYGNFNYLLK